MVSKEDVPMYRDVLFLWVRLRQLACHFSYALLRACAGINPYRPASGGPQCLQVPQGLSIGQRSESEWRARNIQVSAVFRGDLQEEFGAGAALV